MTLKELFSGWKDPKQLLKSCAIASVCFIVIGISDIISYGSIIPLRSLIFIVFGLYQLLCLIIAYRINNKNK